MTIQQDGKAECDRCGEDLGNAAIDKAVSVHAYLNDGNMVTLHIGLACCVRRVFTAKAIAHRQDTSPVTFYNPNGSSNG